MEEFVNFSSNHPFLVGGFFAVLGLILWTEFNRFTRKYQFVNANEAVRIVNKNDAFILDIRNDNELSHGRIAGAKHIPLNHLKNRIKEVSRFKTAPTLVYCQSGSRSTMACQLLTKEGFEDISNLSGGLSAWQAANLPLSKK